MIEIYAAGNDNFENNGDMTLTPFECQITVNLNSAWFLNLRHPIDEFGRWKYIQNGAVIKAKSFNGNQLFRIYATDKTEAEVVASAFPIFLDAVNEVFIVDKRPTKVNGQTALNQIFSGTKYSAKSDIVTTNTAYYVNKNAIEAINGDDENAFTQRWGGQIVYDNYTAHINQRAGGDYGVTVEYGKNIIGIQETISREKLCTRIVPKAYNGYMLEGSKPWVDSPLINSYPTIFTKVVEFEDVKLTEDANDGERSFTTLASLRNELVRRSNLMFSEDKADIESVTLNIDILLLENTLEYKKYKILETISLGDTIHCKHSKLGIETKAQAISLTYNSLTERVEKVTLGAFQNSFFDTTTLITNKISQAIRDDGSVNAQMIQGIINAANAQLKLQNTAAQKQSVRAILFEDLDPNSDLYGALSIGTQGFQIANERTADNRDWKWTTAGTANGIVADAITAGILRGIEIITDRGQIGAFHIDDGKITYKGGLYADYDGSVQHYRVFLQPAYYNGEEGTASNTWVFSTQAYNKNNGENSYYGTWIVYADGRMFTQKNIYIYGAAIRSGNTNDSINLINEKNGVISIGDNSQAYDTRIYTHSEGNTYFSFAREVSNIVDGDTSNTRRNYLRTNSAMVLDANNASNAMYLLATTVNSCGNLRARQNLTVDGNETLGGNLTVKGSATLSGSLTVNGRSKLNRMTFDTTEWTINGSTANRQTIESEGGFVICANSSKNALYFMCSSAYINSSLKCDGDIYLNFYAVSGTIPLAVNSSGQITTTSSSERYKENISVDLDEWLNPERLYDLPVVQYNYKDEFKNNELVAGTQIGIIAEQVDKYYPNACIYNKEGQAESWHERIMIPAMLKLIQKQKEKIDNLEKRIEKLEKEQI